MELFLAERIDGVMILTLNRPSSLNALSQELAEQLSEEISSLESDSQIRAVIITGSGNAFCAGIDLKERRALSPEGKWVQSRALWKLCETIRSSPKAVIAAINGFALGGGFELALACDLRFASHEAEFGWPEMTLGAYPGGGAAVMLPRIIGPARAKELFFTAKHRITARTALNYGLLREVVGREALMDVAVQCAQDIQATSPLGLAAVKKSVNLGSDLPWDEAVELDQKLRFPLEGTLDYQEGIEAFFNKRKPVWKGQ